MSSEDPRMHLLRLIPEWRLALDQIVWVDDTRGQLDTVVVAAHGVRALLRSDSVLSFVTAGIGVHEESRRAELAEDITYAREQVHAALAMETDPAMSLARLHMAETLIRHVIDTLEQSLGGNG